MPSPLSQVFRKNGGGSSAEPIGNEDLECGHGSLVPQVATASGYQSSPSRVYLPEAQSNFASTAPRTPPANREYLSHALCNGQVRSAAHGPLTPSGPSRIIGYLPRTTCFVGPTTRLMPSQSPQNESNGDCMFYCGPQRRPYWVSSTLSHRDPSPRPSFDPDKHGLALQRLETHGSLKTASSIHQDGAALIRPSIFFSENGPVIFSEDYATAFQDSFLQQPESRTSADPYETAYQQPEVDRSSLPVQYLTNTVYQPGVLNQGDFSEIVNLPDAQNIEDGQNSREALSSLARPLPNAEANSLCQSTQQMMHRSQVLHKPHQALSPKPSRKVTIAADTSLDLCYRSPSCEETSENRTIGRIVRISSTGTQYGEQYKDVCAHQVDGEKEQRRLIENPTPERASEAHAIVLSTTFEGIDEYLWSPAPSDDGQEALSASHAPISPHPPSDGFRASPTSGLSSDSHGGFSRSMLCSGEHLNFRSDSSGKPGVNDSPLPHIDVLIPAGNIDIDSHSHFLRSSQHASTMRSRESSSILFHYSGIVTNGASSRPMSEIEFKEEVLHSLGDPGKTALSIPSLADSNSQADGNTKFEQVCKDFKPNAQSEESPLTGVQNPSAGIGPGSSQTSSSLSTEYYGGSLSSHNAHTQNYTLPSLRARCPTPPLLFGKHAIGEPEKSDRMTKSALRSGISCFDQKPRVAGYKETGRLPITLCSLSEQDWETVSAETEARPHAFDNIALITKSGSSLADNSDSGNLSLSKETSYPFRSVGARPLMQHPAHPRHNHSFMLLKDVQTGELVQIPQYEHYSGGFTPNRNASTQLAANTGTDSNYQHPYPLQPKHNHPFTSSSPTVRLTRPEISAQDSCVVLSRNDLNSESSSSGLSEDVQEVKEKQDQNSLYKTTRDTLHAPGPAVNQSKYMMHSREQSHQSSTWLSTVSKVTSNEPSLPTHGTSLAKMIVLDGKGHVNSTPEQRGNREVGSSLADASSPGADFSSSPEMLVSPIIPFSDTPPSLRQEITQQAVRQDVEFSSQRILDDFHKSLARSFNPEDLAISTFSTEDRSRSHSACGSRPQHRKPSPCRRRSSSESHSRLADSPSARKASALNLSSSDGHAQRITSSGPLLRNPFLHSEATNSSYMPNQQKLIERRRHQPEAINTSNDDFNTPSSTDSQIFVRDEFVHTDAPSPTLYHPVHGRNRPWDPITPGLHRPRPQSNSRRHPLFQRPVARAESPHLHRVPHPPTPELLERHVLLSRIYLIPCIVVPPIALLYGHGYMDGIVQFHTMGEINGFHRTEKIVALCWGYSLSAICVLAVVIAMITISASA